MIPGLKEAAERTFFRKSAAPGNFPHIEIGVAQEPFRQRDPPVADGLARSAVQFFPELRNQGRTVGVQLFSQEIHVELRIVKIVPDQLQCPGHQSGLGKGIAAMKAGKIKPVTLSPVTIRREYLERMEPALDLCDDRTTEFTADNAEKAFFGKMC